MTRRLLVSCALLLITALPAAAQRGGGGGGDLSFSIAPTQLGRLERLELLFKLDKDQKKAVKTLLDTAETAAAGARTQLTSARETLAKAVIAGAQPEIDAAASAYGVPAAAMTRIEMQALGDMLKLLTPEQRANGAAIRQAFSMFRGIFLDAKKWDVIPKAEGY